MNVTLPNEVLACPFCGGESHVIYNDLGNKEYIARCRNVFSCGSRGSSWLTKPEAIKAWNARAAAPTTPKDAA